MITIGIDNGSSGTVGVLGDTLPLFFETPTRPFLHYGKEGGTSNRLDGAEFVERLELAMGNTSRLVVRAFVERPFTGKFYKAVVSAHRFFEATIIALEQLDIGYEVVDSGEWQKALLGKVKGSAELKKASMLRGIQLYPQFKAHISKHGDADGLLIAHHYHKLR